MYHIAILNKSLQLLPKILSGEKTIESRWYKARVAPWGRIHTGDTVYFKDAGEPITAVSEVEKVMQFEKPTEAELRNLIKTYGGSPGICLRSSPEAMLEWAKDRRYVILIFLKNARQSRPFVIDKTGFGSACAWITVQNINKIKL